MDTVASTVASQYLKGDDVLLPSGVTGELHRILNRLGAAARTHNILLTISHKHCV